MGDPHGSCFAVLLVAWLILGLFAVGSETSAAGQVSWAVVAGFLVWVTLWAISYWMRARAGVETSGWLNFIFGPVGSSAT
jgi:hypothetical protein